MMINRTWSSVIRWTTGEELNFLRGVAAKGNRKALENYVAIADMREWPAPMDKEQCVGFARQMLAGA